MKRTISLVVAVLMIIAFTGCGLQRIVLNPEVKKSIKTIAMVETPEQEQYFMIPDMSGGSGALMMFGAIGGAIADGIEQKRKDKASIKFDDALAPYELKLRETMLSAMETGLLEKGYEVLRVSPPPMVEDGQGGHKYDLSKIEGVFDAFLVVKLDGGYCQLYEKVSPKINASVTLYSEKGEGKYYYDSYQYCAETSVFSTHIPPDQKYLMKSIEAVYEEIGIAAEGLRVGVERISEHALSGL